ncbi:nucleoside-diphosphate sugar epimerase [Kribbella sindirgiensis]|uniref:Nucleoside-diphosphate sugar epimerase n=1 Tax=Kribbella sindirgiensis TaxID=1124744 RepID=A0A4R0IQJ2_9ACTN|nr:nucleoside-diphosphate sugar epimerase [Kribbella sindirgiensis]TCC34860.1 nucleoside-diphosphate sugar epimerase [Kribbella sindirgiensis]
MILLTGATGNVGRELHELLPEARTLDRSSGADLARPETLDLKGVDTVFLVWPFLTSEGARTLMPKIAEHAQKVVYLSSSAVRFGADTDPITRLHADLETTVQASGLEWTILRADTFASNALGWAGQLQAGDVVRGPDSAATAVIDPADIAAVAAAVLRDSRPGTTYTLTGPDVLSRADQVRILGEALGRELRFDATPFDDARAQLLADGRPPALVEALIGSAQNRPASDLVTTTVEDLTGRPAHTFRAWADRNLATFA